MSNPIGQIVKGTLKDTCCPSPVKTRPFRFRFPIESAGIVSGIS